MFTIYKYRIGADPETDIGVHLHKDAQILSIGEQEGVLYLWAIVNPENDLEMRHFHLVFTGRLLPEDLVETSVYLGTVTTQIDNLVWHIFESRSADVSERKTVRTHG